MPHFVNFAYQTLQNMLFFTKFYRNICLSKKNTVTLQRFIKNSFL